MPKATKKTSARRATKVATNTARNGNKTAKIVALMQRAGGVTRAEVLKVTKWKAISMQQVAEKAGVKLRVDTKERPFKYRVVK